VRSEVAIAVACAVLVFDRLSVRAMLTPRTAMLDHAARVVNW
jgi:hypothetical protein